MESLSVDIEIIPMWTDNYAYVVIDKESRFAAVVDPGEGDAVVKRVKEMEAAGICQLKQIWCTHKHDDHAGGNAIIASEFPGLDVIGTQYEPVPAITRAVGEGSEFVLGKTSVKVIYVPCHTSGHIAFIVTSGRNILFPGDTLFVGGVGRFFEGTGAEMQVNMDRFRELPAETLVYPAHEYTESNLRFLASVDPLVCSSVLAEVQEKRSKGEFTVPTEIGKEVNYNLFMKTREARVQNLIGITDDPVATMTKLREMKNSFR
jgi:hydroxyacylglutathione hydrolase